MHIYITYLCTAHVISWYVIEEHFRQKYFLERLFLFVLWFVDGKIWKSSTQITIESCISCERKAIHLLQIFSYSRSLTEIESRILSKMFWNSQINIQRKKCRNLQYIFFKASCLFSTLYAFVMLTKAFKRDKRWLF